MPQKYYKKPYGALIVRNKMLFFEM